jgi:gliding motility-associated-like protein
MKKLFTCLAAIVLGFSAFSQQLGCLNPTLVFTDPTLPGNPSISSTINCNYAGYIMVSSSPGLNNSLTQGNTPCLRFETSLTNPNASTNNSLSLYQGTTNVGAVCGTCALSIPNNSLYTLYWSYLMPSMSHSYVMCNVSAAANMNYSVFSCYSNVVLASGVWNNASPNNCATVTIPANSAIGTASHAISPTVVPAAIVQNNGDGTIIYDSYQMAAGVYTITYTFNSQNGCTSTATKTLLINNPYTGPGSAFNSPAVQCPYGSCLSLTAQLAGGAYLGGTFSGTGVSSNSFCPSVSGPGTFVVTYSVGVTAICSATNSNTVVVAPQPTANAGVTKSLTCVNNPTVLAGSGGGTYSWSNATLGNNFSASQNPTVGIAGVYSLVVSNGTCSSSPSTMQVVVNTTPPALPGSTVSNVLNCINPTATINTSGAGITYAWTGPGIVSGAGTASPVVNQPGTYNYTVTSTSNGCANSSNVAVTQNTAVSVSLSTVGIITCVSNTASISGNQPNYSYTWTAPGGGAILSGQSTPTVNVSGNGTYSVTVMNPANGCTTVAAISTSINTVQAVPNVSTGGSVNCISNSITLSSSTGGVTYTWVPPGGSSVTSPNNANTNANGSGVYTLNVTNTTNGCINSNTIAAVVQTAQPSANISSSPTITCLNPTVTVNGGPASGVTYTWTGPGVVGSPNGQNVSVNATGVYSLAVTSNSNGCVSASAATVNIVSSLASPTIAMGANQTLPCNPSSVQITSTVSPGTATMVWTGPGVCAGANSATATACAAGVYTLTATNPGNGCSAASTMTVNPAVGLTVSISNTGTITCNTTTVQVIVTASPSPNVYVWTGPGIIAGAATATITVNQGGTYSVVVTNTNGCSSSLNNMVTADNASININSTVTNSVDCVSNTATINTAPTQTTGSYSYSWSGPAVNGATTSAVAVSPSVNTSYTVLVMNPVNGCTATQVVNVTANTIPPSSLSVNPPTFTLSCATPTTVLTASAIGAVSYSWTTTAPGSVISGANTASAGISGASQYTVIAIGANGCASSAQVVTVSPNNNAPTYSLSNSSPSITCFGAASVSVAITSSVPIGSYVWSPTVGISGPTNTSTATFTQSGTYTAVITATNGCSSNAVITVNTNTTAPTIVAGSGTAQALSCTNSMVIIAPTFTPSSDLTYTWTGPGIIGSANDPSVQVNQVGSYSLTVTNTLTGCSTNSIVVAVTGNNTVPSLSVTSSSSLGVSCLPGTSTVGLNAVSGSTNVTYSWSNGATTQNINTSTPGTYTVTVTENGTGCSNTATVAIQNNTLQPVITTSTSGNIPCGGGSASLNVVSSPTNVTYNWSGSGITGGSNSAAPAVNQPGTYTVTVTDNITGCSSSSTVSVGQTSVSALAASDVTTGAAPLNVNFNSTGSSAATYSWSFGDNNSSTQPNPSNTYTAPGTYTVVLTASNGACSASDTLVIKVNQGLGIIPEVFTPNGDGKNETFYIEGLDNYPNTKLQVFNRWGNPVFTASPYDNRWDGTPNVSGKTGSGKLPAGTYFYILELGDSDNTVFRSYIQIQY